METTYDLVIAGGRIIDPSQGLDESGDIALHSGIVARIAPSIDRSEARDWFDASGCIVTPGLIDMHTHVFWGASVLSLDADEYAGKTGTTTWLDAGTSGAANFPAFDKFIIKTATARIVPFLNVSAPGIPMGTGAHAQVTDLDADLAADVIRRYAGTIRGVKVLCSGPQIGPSGLAPLRVAREIADAVGLPVMCHIGAPPPGFAAVAPFLRKGDIVTHAFKGKVGCLVVAGDKIRDEAWEAKRRGVLFDVAHGQSSFAWHVAKAALEQDFLPDCISTDVHAGSINGPAFNMPSVMSKFLHLGIDLVDVISLSSTRPAEILGMSEEIGTLKVGACGDVAILKVEEGEFPLSDCERAVEILERRIIAVRTVRAGLMLTHQDEEGK